MHSGDFYLVFREDSNEVQVDGSKKKKKILCCSLCDFHINTEEIKASKHQAVEDRNIMTSSG